MPWLLNVRLALGLCTLLSSQTGLQAAGAAALPPLPSWARGPGYRGSGQWKNFAIKVGQNRGRALLASPLLCIHAYGYFNLCI